MDFSQNQPAAITLNTGSSRTLVPLLRKTLLTWNPKGSQCNNYQLRQDWLHPHDSKFCGQPTLVTRWRWPYWPLPTL
jgi:hypothetical protein